MPELPEVETIKETLKAHLSGKTVQAVRVIRPEVIATPAAAEFCALIPGRKVRTLERRGKFLLIRLTGCQTLVCHLRMTGRLLWLPPGSPQAPHTHIVISLDGGELHFVDIRRFGRVSLLPNKCVTDLDALASLGPEPLDPGFTPERLAAILTGRKKPLKSILLDQTLIAGIGNIYADEILFAARLRPGRPGASLEPGEIASLHRAIKAVLAAGVDHGGTTVRDYVDGSGQKGSHQDYLCVYHRTGWPCPRCGAPIARERQAGRSTHFCPSCQV